MLRRLLVIFGLLTSAGALADDAFAVVDTSGDGRVDIEEFRQQTLFPAYEELYHEADADGDGRLDEEEFHVAMSRIYSAMGVGGANVF